MKKLISSFFAIAIVITNTSFALADPIEGNWKTQSGETAKIASCGSSYCLTLTTGKFKGQRIGKMKAVSGKYTGTVTDPEDNKVYTGSASLKGSIMSLKGCALKIFCKTQEWNKL